MQKTLKTQSTKTSNLGFVVLASLFVLSIAATASDAVKAFDHEDSIATAQPIGRMAVHLEKMPLKTAPVLKVGPQAAEQAVKQTNE